MLSPRSHTQFHTTILLRQLIHRTIHIRTRIPLPLLILPRSMVTTLPQMKAFMRVIPRVRLVNTTAAAILERLE